MQSACNHHAIIMQSSLLHLTSHARLDLSSLLLLFLLPLLVQRHPLLLLLLPPYPVLLALPPLPLALLAQR
jgi:hypothetical protein